MTCQSSALPPALPTTSPAISSMNATIAGADQDRVASPEQNLPEQAVSGDAMPYSLRNTGNWLL